MDQRCEQLRIPHLDYEESFPQVRDKLWEEVRLDREQRHLAQSREFSADEPRVQIPELLDRYTKRVTVMQRVTGTNVTDHNLSCSNKRRQLAQLIVKTLTARPIFCHDSRAIFHCDPHAGNLFLTTDDRLALLDWSLVGTLAERERIAIVQIVLAALTLQPHNTVQVLEGLGERQSVDRAALGSIVLAWLLQIRYGQLPGLTWLVGMLDQAVQFARLRVGADLMLFRKTLHTLEGVVAEIGGSDFRIDNVLFTESLRQFAMEWPRRWRTRLDSRKFSTRISNLDLAQAVLRARLTHARYWTGQTFDMLESCGALANASTSPVSVRKKETEQVSSEGSATCPSNR